MRTIISGLVLIVFCAACNTHRQVDFVYFNLGTNEIKVTVVGIPKAASPGVLVPVHDEDNQLDEVSSTFSEAIKIEDRLKIIWQESNASHEVTMQRRDLKLPAKLVSGKVRFTYLGNEKWRIKLLENKGK